MSDPTRLPVTICTDGACRPNPGPGAWAAVLSAGGREKVISGRAEDTTNQRMELCAIVEALQALKTDGCLVTVVSDSQYALRVCSGVWNAKSNRGLVSEAQQLAARHDVTWEWVRAHDGHAGNERAHREANRRLNEANG
jgi:ribonuclease HI